MPRDISRTPVNRAVELVFDLDGTISDPLIGIHRSIDYALSCAGLEPVPESTVAGLIGPPLDDAFRALVPACSERDIAGLVTSYRQRYAEVGYAENALYDGIVAALTAMSDRGVRLGLCTSKRVDFAEKILVRFEIRELFEFVDGGDVGISKTRQLEALGRSGQVDRGSTMIGDRAIDITSAHAGGLASIGVLWGYGTAKELREAGAVSIVDNVSELCETCYSATGRHDGSH